MIFPDLLKRTDAIARGEQRVRAAVALRVRIPRRCTEEQAPRNHEGLRDRLIDHSRALSGGSYAERPTHETVSRRIPRLRREATILSFSCAPSQAAASAGL
jgi:hypothetical protein